MKTGPFSEINSQAPPAGSLPSLASMVGIQMKPVGNRGSMTQQALEVWRRPAGYIMGKESRRLRASFRGWVLQG